VPPRTTACERLAFTAIFSLLLIGGGVTLVLWLWLEGWGVHAEDTIVKLTDEPAVQRPMVLPAGACWLPDDEEVLGVSAGGRHRAYHIRALAVVNRHILNDQLGSMPVTVSYCDSSDCIEVFLGAAGQDPLDVAPGGVTGEADGGTLLLRLGTWYYRQDTTASLEKGAPPFPYAKSKFARTTWKRWREAHPDTDLYVEERPSDSGGARVQFMDQPAVRKPLTVRAGVAPLHDEDEVIGVRANGLSRAYLVRALLERPLVNDELGGTHVSVSYFFPTDCVQVFTGAQRGKVLDIVVAGQLSSPLGAAMLLRVGPWHYRQDTGMSLEKEAPSFPYVRTEFERTTWQPWRVAHPDTDVYIGKPPAGAR
jgi:hypothetical protein